MKTSTRPQRVPTRFERPTRFRLKPLFAAADLTARQVIFEQLKTRLLQPVLHGVTDPALHRQLRLAGNEAAAVAWTTPYPLLFLPMLLEEKAEEVHDYKSHQAAVRRASSLLGAIAE
ncbi:MAG: hypothetical protein U1G07_14270 [Verrucomicrobiota bacterium]